ncbi:aspartate kinase-like protein [Mollisia scopiformis]|uniref:Aspartokinase n=1 Tax=Mollisia scopiformis TaxID=149040 RepID=A0A194XIA2_MOLSC|nr:aspartate kinase-like protein [Mollisia scopiformis]KUJ19854.1 aspartate kinase-like protein [Mollisia scopiformis]
MSPNGQTNGVVVRGGRTEGGAEKVQLLKRRNDSEGGWIVQKFGGTSVGKFAKNIAEDIVRASLKNNKIAVVCSARSTGKKVEGTTSRLLEIFGVLEEVNAIKDTESVHYESLVNEYERLVYVIREDHISAAKSSIQDNTIQANLIKEIENECNELIDYRAAAERWHLEINGRSKDRIVSFGEKLSCRFVAALLEDRGVESEFVDLSDVIHFKALKGLDMEFYRLLAAELREKILACEKRVPVVTGYFGAVPGGLMDGEIGRGYTDLCAALIAVGMKAEELQVWKEVDGIFTADPTKVPTARLLPTITPSEAAELTFYGSEVIHHLTMDQVIHATPPIQIRIKNVKNPVGSGTIVLPDAKSNTTHLSHSRSSSSFSSLTRKTPKRPTAVTIKDKISVINVHSNKRSISHGFFAKVFSILDRKQLSVDLISTSEVHVSMAIHSANLSDETLAKVKEELEECGEVSILSKMAILSLVGAEMKNMIGIAGRMFSTLGEHNVNIEMISQGASEINISCVIDAYEATRAMNILHTNLFTFLE